MAGIARLENRFERFAHEATRAGASVEKVHSDPTSVAIAASRTVSGAGRVIVADPTNLAIEIREALSRMPGVIDNPTDDDLAVADAGITGAFAAVATTGSICVRVDDRLTGFASLLAPLHVAIVSSSTFVDRPSDIFSSNLGKEALPADFVFITGPSATADMGPLVRGVHGPHRLHIIVLEVT